MERAHSRDRSGEGGTGSGSEASERCASELESEGWDR
jgi:hypothetical protein